jgi:hypothetical protein
VKLYLSGPIRGYPDENKTAFTDAAAQLRELGHEVFNPHEQPRHDGDIRACMALDCKWICEQADGMVLLPRWNTSLGARAEYRLACAIDIDIWEYSEFLARKIQP